MKSSLTFSSVLGLISPGDKKQVFRADLILTSSRRTLIFLRTTGKPVIGSASLALSKSNPPFTRIALFELAANSQALEAKLREKHPGVAFRMYSGD